MNNEEDILRQTLLIAYINGLKDKPKPTAWKIGDVEFILEPNNKVYIIGNGEINIDVATLKKIVEVLDETPGNR